MIGVTGVIIAKNEAADLPATLEAWSSVCDFGVLVDDRSDDDTPNLASDRGYAVIETQMDETGFSGLRNLGLSAVRTELALVFDADEIPDPQLLTAIADVKETGATGTYRLDRTSIVLGKPMQHGRWGRDKQIRLMPPDTRYDGIVHEHPLIDDDTVVTDLDGTVLHQPYKSFQEYLEKMRAYAAQNAERNIDEGQEIGPAYIAMRFAGNLVIRRGFQDGWRGFVLAAGDVWYDSLTLSEQRKQQGRVLLQTT